MKSLRKIISFLLVLALVFGLVPMPSSETGKVFAAETPSGPTNGTCGANIHWELTKDTQTDWDLEGDHYKLTLTGSGDMNSYSGDDQPWRSYGPLVTSISIGEGITSIGDSAFFRFVSLKEVTLPNSVASVGANAFGQCSLLETVVCGTGLKSIGDSAFSNDVRLNSIRFNEGLETIEGSAFSFCSRLQTVSLPDSLLALKSTVFDSTDLTSITIPVNVSEIGDNCLLSNQNLQNISVAEGNTHFGVWDNVLYQLGEDGSPYKTLAYAYGSNSDTINIKDQTQIIGNKSFYMAESITSVNFPNTLKEIGKSAFAFCGIERLDCSEGLETIGVNAFAQCGKLREVYISDSVTKIAMEAFLKCTALKSVSVGKSLRYISGDSFSECTSLDTITISEENPRMEAIDNVVYNKAHTCLYMYAPGKKDEVYHLLDTVETLYSFSISYAHFLKELYMPETLNDLSSNASIIYNSNLKSIYFAGNAPMFGGSSSISYNAGNLLIYRDPSTDGWDDNAWKDFQLADWDPNNTVQNEGEFGDISWKYEGDKGRIIFTGTGTLPDFTEENPAPWSSYISDIQTIEAEHVVTIGDCAFQHAGGLLRVETGAELQRIGDYAFADCGKLVYPKISAVEEIGTGAFQNDVSMKEYLDLEKVSSIGAGAFQGCSTITDITLGAHLVVLEENVFSGCSALINFMVPEQVASIGSGALTGCSSLRTINIPASVQSIGSQAFAGDAQLLNVYFYGSVPRDWAVDSFEGCNTNLTLYYRAAQAGWSELGQIWNEIPLVGLDKFYTEKKDHYSFSNTASSFGYSSDYRIPRQRYVDVLDSIVTGTYYYAINDGWNGSCYGMAGSTLEFYENSDKFQIADYDASARNLYALSAPGNKDAALTKLIEAYQIS